MVSWQVAPNRLMGYKHCDLRILSAVWGRQIIVWGTGVAGKALRKM